MFYPEKVKETDVGHNGKGTCCLMGLNKSKYNQSNVGLVKQEAPDTDDMSLKLLEHQMLPIKSEPVSTENQPFELTSKILAQDCDVEYNEDVYIKQEQLHEELNIKNEDEAMQGIPLDNKHYIENQLKLHLRTHTDEKPFKCYFCNYACRQNGLLKVHLRTHTGEKPFKCNLCDYACRRNGHLKVHLRTHTGEKPFKCNLCDYACRQNGSLKVHLRTHTGEKPFKCNLCDYAATQNSRLKSHLKTHTGEGLFKCNICGLSFQQRNHLQDHYLRTHTSVKPINFIT